MVIEGPRNDFDIGLKTLNRLFAYASPFIFFMVSFAVNSHCPLILCNVEFVYLFNSMGSKNISIIFKW